MTCVSSYLNMLEFLIHPFNYACVSATGRIFLTSSLLNTALSYFNFYLFFSLVFFTRSFQCLPVTVLTVLFLLRCMRCHRWNHSEPPAAGPHLATLLYIDFRLTKSATPVVKYPLLASLSARSYSDAPPGNRYWWRSLCVSLPTNSSACLLRSLWCLAHPSC